MKKCLALVFFSVSLSASQLLEESVVFKKALSLVSTPQNHLIHSQDAALVLSLDTYGDVQKRSFAAFWASVKEEVTLQAVGHQWLEDFKNRSDVPRVRRDSTEKILEDYPIEDTLLEEARAEFALVSAILQGEEFDETRLASGSMLFLLALEPQIKQKNFSMLESFLQNPGNASEEFLNLIEQLMLQSSEVPGGYFLLLAELLVERGRDPTDAIQRVCQSQNEEEVVRAIAASTYFWIDEEKISIETIETLYRYLKKQSLWDEERAVYLMDVIFQYALKQDSARPVNLLYLFGKTAPEKVVQYLFQIILSKKDPRQYRKGTFKNLLCFIKKYKVDVNVDKLLQIYQILIQQKTVTPSYVETTSKLFINLGLTEAQKSFLTESLRLFLNKKRHKSYAAIKKIIKTLTGDVEASSSAAQEV